MGEEIFTMEELTRIRKNVVKGKDVISVDVHGYDRKKAMRFVRNIIALNYRNDEFKLVVIHGFNHGTAIKEELRKQTISSRVKEKNSIPTNPGVTILELA